MAKELLRCDICGGSIEVQAGGKKGICENCGASYSLERMREIYSGMKVSVTGTKEDVEQWKRLVETYLHNLDFVAAESVVKKILEAVPSDRFANTLYSQLQDWKYYEVKNSVLIGYSGKQKELILPPGIIEIYDQAFRANPDIENVIIPDSVRRIGNEAFSWTKIMEIILPTSVYELGENVFSYCHQLKTASISDKIDRIPAHAFEGCVSLENIVLSKRIKHLGEFAFADCCKLQGTLSFPNIETIGACAFYGCWSLTRIILGSSLKSVGNNALMFHDSIFQKDERPVSQRKPVSIEYHGSLLLDTEERREIMRKKEEEKRHREQQEYWRTRNKCQYCGGDFKGIFKKCVKCGKSKDY